MTSSVEKVRRADRDNQFNKLSLDSQIESASSIEELLDVIRNTQHTFGNAGNEYTKDYLLRIISRVIREHSRNGSVDKYIRGITSQGGLREKVFSLLSLIPNNADIEKFNSDLSSARTVRDVTKIVSSLNFPLTINYGEYKFTHEKKSVIDSIKDYLNYIKKNKKITNSELLYISKNMLPDIGDLQGTLYNLIFLEESVSYKNSSNFNPYENLYNKIFVDSDPSYIKDYRLKDLIEYLELWSRDIETSDVLPPSFMGGLIFSLKYMSSILDTKSIDRVSADDYQKARSFFNDVTNDPIYKNPDFSSIGRRIINAIHISLDCYNPGVISNHGRLTFRERFYDGDYP